MNITFFPKQIEAHEAVLSNLYSLILFGGAVRGGKSVWGMSELILLCEAFPKSRWCIIREDIEKIRTTTIPSFKKLGSIGKLRESPYEYTHRNGSVILFKGENFNKDKDLDWMKGLEVNGILFEEINECQRATFFKAFERVGTWIIPELKIQPPSFVIATCNPTQGWVKELVYTPWKEGRLRPNWKYIQSRVYDNVPFLEANPGYIEFQKQNLNRYEYEVFIEGDWDIQLKTGGEFYKCFEINRHIRPVFYNLERSLHISWDDNVWPYLPCGIFQIEGKELRMIDEITGVSPNNRVEKVCNIICERYKNHTSGMFIYGDATAKKEDTKLEFGMNFYKLILGYLAQFRPTSRVLNSNPSVEMRGKWINTIFEKNIGGISFVIGENCKTAINDFVCLKESEDGRKLKEMVTDPITKIRYQKYGHMTDLFDYIAVSAFASEYARYQNAGRSSSLIGGKPLASKNAY
jgi:hypothetical protein